MVNVVIIGSGSIAFSRHIPSIQKSKNGRLYGFYNRNFQRTQKTVEQFGGIAYRSLNEIWEDKLVDAVIICSPTPSHCELTISSLNAGKHVLCEKPMAMNIKEAKAMREAAKKSGKKLMISHNQRFYKPHMIAKELLRRNEIGKILTFRTFLGVVGRNDPTGVTWKNSIAEVGSHRIDLMRYLLGADVKKVFAHLMKLDLTLDTHGDDNGMVLLEYENGVTGIIVSSRTSYNANDRMTQIFGTEGAITLYGEKHLVIVEKRNGEKKVYTLPNEFPQSVVEITGIDEKFIDSIVYDTEPIITAKDGEAVVRTIDAIYLSNEQERWVYLEEISSIKGD